MSGGPDEVGQGLVVPGSITVILARWTAVQSEDRGRGGAAGGAFVQRVSASSGGGQQMLLMMRRRCSWRSRRGWLMRSAAISRSEVLLLRGVSVALGPIWR
jgi:hypothetical protein